MNIGARAFKFSNTLENNVIRSSYDKRRSHYCPTGIILTDFHIIRSIWSFRARKLCRKTNNSASDFKHTLAVVEIDVRNSIYYKSAELPATAYFLDPVYTYQYIL